MLLGKPFMPWQQHVADVVLELDPDTGRLVYDEFRLTVPRQSGKSTLLLAKALHRASATQFFGARQQIMYSAQTRKDSRKKWEEDYLATIKESRAFRSRVVEHLGNGNEHMRFPNGSRFGIESTTEKSGHGSTLDEAFVDEAFAQIDGRTEQAFRPAMITRPNAQLGVVSTAGWLDASPYLWAKVTHGRQLVTDNVRRGVAYFEWSAPEDADPLDPEVWAACMPALGLLRPDGSGITVEKIAAEMRAFEGSPEGLNGFRRAYLNQWVPKEAPALSVLNLDAWDRLADKSPDPSMHVGALVLAIDTDPDRARTSIVAAGQRADGLPLIEVIDRHKVGAVIVDKRAAAGSLIAALEAARVRVVATGPGEMAQACGQFYDTVTETGRLRHLDQPELNDAIRGAATRPLGDAWAWDRKKRSEDITPLTAATLALWAWAGKVARPANAGRGRVIALG